MAGQLSGCGSGGGGMHGPAQREPAVCCGEGSAASCAHTAVPCNHCDSSSPHREVPDPHDTAHHAHHAVPHVDAGRVAGVEHLHGGDSRRRRRGGSSKHSGQGGGR